jgi:hypothetical protein
MDADSALCEPGAQLRIEAVRPADQDGVDLAVPVTQPT